MKVNDKLKEQLQEHGTLLDTILNSTPDLVILKDRKSVYQHVNSAFCKFLDKQEDEIIGKTDFDLFPPDEAEMYRIDDARVMETGKSQIKDEVTTGKEGAKWLRVAKTPVLNKKGATIGVLCSVQDITERKEAEENLRTSKERYALAEKMAKIGSWEYEIDSESVYWSDSIASLFGFKPGEFAGTQEALIKCVHPDDLENFLNVTNELLEKGRNEFSIEYRIAWPDGTTRWVLSTGGVIRDDYKKAVRITGMVQDITERKKMEEELQKAKDELEERVKERTAQLESAVELLEDEINERKKIEDAVKKSEEKYKSFVEGANDAITTIDSMNNLTSWNKRAEEIFGYTSEEIIGKPVSILVPEELKAEQKEIINKVTEKGFVRNYETVRVARSFRNN
jgi:PAS domain S-box-containing protein